MIPFSFGRFVAAVVVLAFFEATRVVFRAETESARTEGLLKTNSTERRPSVFAGFRLPSFPSPTTIDDDAVTHEFEDDDNTISFLLDDDQDGAYDDDGLDQKGEEDVDQKEEDVQGEGDVTTPASSSAPASAQGEGTTPPSSIAPAPAPAPNRRKRNKRKGAAPVRIIRPDTSTASAYAVKADDPRFQNLYSEFLKALHTQPEEVSLRPWYLPGTEDKKDKQVCIDYFPGLSESLVQDAFRGKRITTLGDSTSLYMTQKLQFLLLHYPSDMIDQFTDLNLTEGKDVLGKAGYVKRNGYRRRFLRSSNRTHDDPFSDCGGGKEEEEDDDFGMVEDSNSSDWRQTSRRLRKKTKRLHLKIQPDGTSIEWEGRNGDARETVCRWDDVLQHIDEEQPHVMMINFGLHWLHLFGHGRNGVPCSVHLWNTYEDWLDRMVGAAVKNGAKLVFFKTTNHICEKKYKGAYAEGLKLYGDKSNTDVIQSCVDGISKLTQALTDDEIDRYCREGHINNFGVNKFNERLFNFMQLQKEKVKKGELPSDMIFEMFRDNEVQRCEYSSDGRHYGGQDLARVRLLGNLIQCLYTK